MTDFQLQRSNTTECDAKMMKNEEQVRFWKEDDMAYIKVLSWYLIVETKRNHKTLVRRTNNLTHQTFTGTRDLPNTNLENFQYTNLHGQKTVLHVHSLNLWWKRLNMVCKNIQQNLLTEYDFQPCWTIRTHLISSLITGWFHNHWGITELMICLKINISLLTLWHTVEHT
jgi:hypothetical protein